MGERENQERNDNIFSEVVRAGKRTYFFDVKATKANQQYLTITESKRRFSEEHGKFFYDKHKIFLYGEDFEKFKDGLNSVISYIENSGTNNSQDSDYSKKEKFNSTSTLNFEDLGDEPASI